MDVNIHYFPVKTAIIFPPTNTRYTFTELFEAVNRLGNGLKELGVKKGDRVCIYVGNRPETVISYLAVWRIGAIAVPANIVLKKDELKHILNDSEANTLITTREAYEKVAAEALKESPSVKNTILIGGNEVSWEKIMKEASSKLRAENCSLDDLCHLQYTAGTTGKPKGAMLTHGNWMAAVETERWVHKMTENDVYLGFYPHAHVGISWGLAALKYGATFIIMERFNLDDYLKWTKEYGVTILSGMPPVLYTLANSPPGTEEYLKSVRSIITGGATTPQEVWEKFVKRFPHIQVVNAYGLSETVVVGTAPATPVGYMHLSKGYRSVGAPVGYCEVKIVDEKDPTKELGPNETGEIALRGPGVAKGYWKAPELTKKTFLPDGWFLTGDMGYLDEDGVLFITGRKKDLIIMSGWNIYPAEVENVLMKHPKIADAAVFARYDERRGEIPAAAIKLKPGEKATEEEIISFCRERLAGYKVPRYIVFVESLPRVGGWKIMRRVLREMYGGFPKEK